MFVVFSIHCRHISKSCKHAGLQCANYGVALKFDMRYINPRFTYLLTYFCMVPPNWIHYWTLQGFCRVCNPKAKTQCEFGLHISKFWTPLFPVWTTHFLLDSMLKICPDLVHLYNSPSLGASPKLSSCRLVLLLIFGFYCKLLLLSFCLQ